MGTSSSSRSWIDLDHKISERVLIKKIASYEAPWTYLLNGNNIKEETGMKFDDSIMFESSRKVSSLQEASELLISKIRDHHSGLFHNEGIYLIHIKVEPAGATIRGEGLAYKPFYIVQALVNVGNRQIH